MTSESLFSFTEEDKAPTTKPSDHWKVLSVEDDPAYQASLSFALENQRIFDRHISLLKANSAKDAAAIIAANPDISVILLDVVMETDDAGLKLVNTIREVIGNAAIRIVLLTGQPSMAPRNDVMKRYDIDDYWCKSDLSSEYLQTIITGNIRTWCHIQELNRAKQGLQMVIDASQQLSFKRDLHEFTQVLLEEISRLLNVEDEGIVCSLISRSSNPLDHASILAATGKFAIYQQKTLLAINDKSLLAMFQAASWQKQHIFGNHVSILYFENEELHDKAYIIMVNTDRALTEHETYLLEVFSTNISNGFTNLALYSRLSELAYTHAGLGIPNRNHFLRSINNATEQDKRSAIIVVVKVDDFTDLTLTFGEEFCTDLLRSIYKRLKSATRALEPIAMIAQDSFGLLLNNTSPHDASFFDQLLNPPFTISDAGHSLSTTVGILDISTDGELPIREAERLVRLVEGTVLVANRQQQNYLRFEACMENDISTRSKLLSELRNAIHQQTIFIEIQPKIDLQNNHVIGFEALARWTLNDQKIPPDTFIPLAETSGLITKLDLLIAEKTAQALQKMAMSGLMYPIAINASAPDLLNDEYRHKLFATLNHYRITPNQIELEITETKAMRDYRIIAPQLRSMIDIGMKVSLDDFGTGYSSLAYITDLAATGLKIDRAFIQRATESDADEKIVSMILHLGRFFDLEVIAEGIETQAQAELLKNMGCPFGQGYLYARPMSFDDAIEWTKSHNAQN